MMIHVDIYKREFSSRKEFFFSPFFFTWCKRKGASLSKRRKLQTPFLLYFPGTVLRIHQLESTAQAARQPRASFSCFSFTIRISFISRYQTSKRNPPSRWKSSNAPQGLDSRRRRRRRLMHIKHRDSAHNRRRRSQSSWRRRAYLCRSNRSPVSRCRRCILGSIMKMREFGS